jgi:hypothetical protein
MERHKALGAFKAICGNDMDQIKYLLKKSDDMIEQLSTG